LSFWQLLLCCKKDKESKREKEEKQKWDQSKDWYIIGGRRAEKESNPALTLLAADLKKRNQHWAKLFFSFSLLTS